VSGSLKKTFIQSTQAPFFVEAAARAKREGFRSRELTSGGHDSMITQSAALARMLVELA
jgi:hypothetical protein